MQEKLDKESIKRFSKSLIKIYFRGLGIIVSCPLIYQIIKELNKENYKHYIHDFQRQKREFIVKRPNQQQVINQHNKLSQQGFEIYTAINTYSRNIIQVYIEISNYTVHSILAQFLYIVRHLRYYSQIISSDKRKEILFLAEVQYSLSRITYPILSFEKVFKFRSSIKNQRIKSQQAQLQKSALYLQQVSILTYYLILLYNILVSTNN